MCATRAISPPSSAPWRCIRLRSLLPELSTELIQPRVAAAAGDVELVLHGVLLVVVLVVVLGGPEFARRGDRRQDWLPEGLVLLPLRLRGLGEALLLGAMVENFR